MISGYLAARSIIKNENYDILWKKIIKPHVKASLVNRWYYKILNKRAYIFILKKISRSKNSIAFFRKVNNYSLIHRIGIPFASFFLRKKFKDRRSF